MKRIVALMSLLLILAIVSAACTPAGTPPITTNDPQATADPAPGSESGVSPDSASRATPATGAGAGERLVLYSGRSESLVGPILEEFEAATGIGVDVKYGGTAELAATLLEEGSNSPADVFWAQDPGGLGAVAAMLARLPEDIVQRVDTGWRDPEGRWVGLSGRARTVVYNTEHVQPDELPADLWGFTDPQWKGRIGWAPTNSSFQTMVTAMRTVWGEEKAREWLTAILANEPAAYDKNSAIVDAVGAGEVDIGFVNHYYLYPFLKEQGDTFPARNHFLNDAGPGSLVMVSGAGILNTTQHATAAHELVRFLLEEKAQNYFASETFEYPLVGGVPAAADIPPLASLNAPAIDVADLADLQGSVRLLQEVGVLP